MKKKMMFLATILMFFGAVNAYAVPVTINVDELYDWGRLYTYSLGVYTPANVNPAPFGTNPLPGYTIPPNTVGNADLAEDSWGVGTVASIKTVPGNVPIWVRTATEQLTFMFYGFNDDYISNPTIFGKSDLYATGGHLQVWLNAAPPFDGTLGTAGRTGVSSYTSATGGILVLDLVPTLLPVGPGNWTFVGNNDLTTGSGSGSMFLSVTGLGAWDAHYDTNSQLYNSDFSLTFTVRNNSGPVIGDWVVRGDAGGESFYIPEPATLLLLGLGLIGIGLARRYRRD